MYRFFILVLTVIMCLSPRATSEGNDVRRAIQSGELIRLHIIADSDSPEDQALKLQVRDALLHVYQSRMETYKDSPDALMAWVADNLADIENTAIAAARAGGYDGPVSAQFGKTAFPERDYAGTRVPAGEYMALRILIGEAQGRNWWCVMFPPLCFPLATTQEETAVPRLDETTTPRSDETTTPPSDEMAQSADNEPAFADEQEEQAEIGNENDTQEGGIRFTSTILKWIMGQ